MLFSLCMRDLDAASHSQLIVESGDADDFEDQFLEDVRTGDGSDGEPAPAAAAGDAKKPKRKRAKGSRRAAAEFEASRNLAADIAKCPAGEQADWLWRSFQQLSGASPLEREGLTEASFVALSGRGSLEEQLKVAEPAWWDVFGSVAGRRNGAPSCLLVSPSAMGAVHLIKSCGTFNRSCRVAKLFAKHFKVADQAAALKKDRVAMGAGTPHRLCALADAGALQLGALKWVVLDVHMDAKQRTILDVPEVRADWWAFWEKHLRARVAGGHTRLALFCGEGGAGEG
jgi:protein CMS1